MKLVEPSQVENKSAQVDVYHNAPPACDASKRRFDVVVISVLVLACVFVLVAITHRSVQPDELPLVNAADRSARAASPATFQEEVSRVVHNFVRHFDGSQGKAGERLSGISPANLRNVVAGPNQTVLLRRGQLPHALYVLGENGYVIIAGNESKLVRLDDLRALPAGTSTLVAR